MRGEDVGRALEYADPRDSIKKLYRRNAEELDCYSVVLKLPVSDKAPPREVQNGPAGIDTQRNIEGCGDSVSPQVGVNQPESQVADEFDGNASGITQLRGVRVFNEEGVMILTMLSSQPKARQFRAWAVKILKSYRHGELAFQGSSAKRDRLFELCIREARLGNAVAVRALIDRFGFPESIRDELRGEFDYRAKQGGLFAGGGAAS